MARWNKLNAKSDYGTRRYCSLTAPPQEIITNSFDEEDNDKSEFDDLSILEDIENIDLEELCDTLTERLDSLAHQFERTHQGVFLLAIAKIFTRIFEEEDHYYQDHCKSCYTFGVGAIRFCLMASIFDADSDDVDEILASINIHFESQYDLQRICEREGKFIAESIKKLGPEQFLKNLF